MIADGTGFYKVCSLRLCSREKNLDLCDIQELVCCDAAKQKLLILVTWAGGELSMSCLTILLEILLVGKKYF